MKEPPRELAATTSINSSGALVKPTDEKAEDKGIHITVSVFPRTPQSKTNAIERAPKISRLSGIFALLKSPRLLAAMFGVFIETIIASLCATLPLFVNSTFHWTALAAGIIFLCIAIPTGCGPLAGALSDRFGACWVAISGFALTAPMLILLRLVTQDSLEHKVLLCMLLVLLGATLTLFLSPLGAECTFVAEETSRTVCGDLYASSFSLMNCSLASAGGLVDALGWKWMTVLLGMLLRNRVHPMWTGDGKQTAGRYR